jgi:hypothetical protein
MWWLPTLILTDKVDGIALLALFQVVVVKKMIPVQLLFFAQHPCTLAEGARCLQGSLHRLANKSRAIGELLKAGGKRFVSLKGKGTFFFHRMTSRTKSNTE